MKHLLIFTSIFLLTVKVQAQNVGIGTITPATILDVTSTSQGVLIPRLTTIQMYAITSPASGLLITNTDSANRIFIYTGTTWKGLSFTDELGSGGGAGASRGIPTILTDGADITWDIATTGTTNAEITLTGSNRNLNIINPVAGEVYRIKINQDGSGFRTIGNWPANAKWEGGVVPTLTITANGYDIVTFYYDGTNFNGSARLNYN